MSANMPSTRINPRLWIAVVALLAAVVLLPGRAHAANVTVDLCATNGSISVPATPAAVRSGCRSAGPNGCRIGSSSAAVIQ